jgi:hypothetical protein
MNMMIEQRKALQAMADKNIGALPINEKWIFPCHVRESVDIAIKVCERLGVAL